MARLNPFWDLALDAANRGDAIAALCLQRYGSMNQNPTGLNAHDHGNCELCDALEGHRASLATRLKGIIESLATQEPRRDCISALERLAKELAAPQIIAG